MRSAVVAATVVAVAVTLAGGCLALLLYRSLLSGIDDAAASRVRDIASSLKVENAGDLDREISGDLVTDERIDVVQIFDSAGRVVGRSDSAPQTPLVALDTVGGDLRIGIPVRSPSGGDLRVSAQTVEGPAGRYTVLVGAGSEAVGSTVATVVALLAAAAPIVVTVSAAATYQLVRHSMRSVDMIRARVSEISAAQLAERIPVPRQRDEIAALAITMNAMLARVDASHTAQRRFVGDASHELRSPLATIISALEVAMAHPDLFNQELATSILMPEAQRMQSLIEDLLLLARADERGLALRHDDVDLDDLAATAVARMRRDSTLILCPVLIPTRVVGDAGALARVVWNLLDNAVRHARSRVEVTVDRVSDSAILTVSDDGPGIPEVDRIRVFDRFVRLDSDRSRSQGGTGLGLAIVSEIVAAHGGGVVVEDRAGGGTVVRIQLPAVAPPGSSR